MNDYPMEGHEYHMLALECEWIEFSVRCTLGITFIPAQGDRCIHFDEFVASLVRDPEFERRDAPIWRNNGFVAVDNLSAGAGEPCKKESRCQSEAEQTNQCLQGDENICGESMRTHASIADGCKGLDTEEKFFEKLFSESFTSHAFESIGAAERVSERKQRVGDEVCRN